VALFCCGTVLAGQYQRATDDKTLVWNENHKAGDVVSWSGKRDADGYATGYGTLTWYAPKDALEVGSNVPRKHNRILSRVSGTMVRGKFEEASSQGTPGAAVEASKPKKRGWLSSIFKFGSKPTPAPVEPTPKPRRRSVSTHTEAAPEERSPASTDAPSSATPSPSAADHSLGESMNAPSSLKLGSPAAAPTPEVSLRPAETASPSPTP